ncbi:MAG: bifunctional molybdenum cofactor biosynthesis protein MoaC/MoaB [Alphaproteobacteria bacterium]|nr:bifunctional molybdenum cofactor biosynthesis protein MoaC/MoaB [Alphaproteobacteria bacterium]MDD9919057.1 bifunctional molybdenum cofactor biosynthesis protein MoaC/MoaB [Alphaproteobacteria bacterium]
MKKKMAHPCSPRDEAQAQVTVPGESRFGMIHVGEKPATKRRAVACGGIQMGQEAFVKLQTRTLPKGDALALAEIAGIQAAKQTANILPMCHPLPLDVVGITWELIEETCTARMWCEVRTVAKTGVEMEALAGVNGALLCLYDVLKGTDPALTVLASRLELKEGGKTGVWVHPDASEHWQQLLEKVVQYNTTAAVVVVSDRASRGEYEDLAGPAVAQELEKRHVTSVDVRIVPDEEEILAAVLQELVQEYPLVLTTGGTGPAARDITPEVVTKLADKVLPGIGEALRQYGLQFTKTTWLSRSIGARLGQSLVVTLPGNPKAIAESFPVLDDVVPTLLRLIGRDEV